MIQTHCFLHLSVLFCFPFLAAQILMSKIPNIALHVNQIPRSTGKHLNKRTITSVVSLQKAETYTYTKYLLSLKYNLVTVILFYKLHFQLTNIFITTNNFQRFGVLKGRNTVAVLRADHLKSLYSKSAGASRLYCL